jgi:endonuclease-3
MFVRPFGGIRLVSLPLKEKRDLTRRIDELLCAEYGKPQRRKAEDPIDVLIRTILSQNTTDTNSRRAFDGLKDRFSNWDSVRSAPTKRIERAIRVGGLANVKAKRIRDILNRIHAEHGTLSLRPLRKMNLREALEILLGYSGVGSKTANCVLLFGFGMNAFPVDTHILRISRRIGLIPENTSLARSHDLWALFLPGELAYTLHLNLIAHGRGTCRPQNPRCRECCLGSVCGSRGHFLEEKLPGISGGQ